jgi:hypothetical protein
MASRSKFLTKLTQKKCDVEERPIPLATIKGILIEYYQDLPVFNTTIEDLEISGLTDQVTVRFYKRKEVRRKK